MSDNRKEELLDIATKAEQDLASDRLKFGRQEGTGFGGKDTKGGSTSSMSLPSLISIAYADFLPQPTNPASTNP